MTATPRLPPIGGSHPRVRQYLAVARRRADDSAGLVALEGLWALRAALDADVPIDVVFLSPPLVRGGQTRDAVDEARRRGAELLAVSPKLIRRMVTRDGPDGVAAIAQLRRYRLNDIHVGRTTRLLVVDGMELAGNLGALIRSADGAGATAVVFTARRIRLTHPLAVKASMGTLLSMPLVDAETDETLAWCRARHMRVVAADPAAGCSYRGQHYAPPVAVVVGGERQGLSAAWRSAVDVMVSIPMLGEADSLNIGHAASLLLYEALHQTRA